MTSFDENRKALVEAIVERILGAKPLHNVTVGDVRRGGQTGFLRPSTAD